MKLLDLFCGAGGAAVGYHRAGFDTIVGVDNKPQKHYPFQFVQADALEYLAEHGHEFDAIHASPPCQGYSIMRNLPWLRHKSYPLLIDPTREMLEGIGKPWIIENVMGAHLEAGWLCGTMFGLPFYRHRSFESSLFWMQPGHPRHEFVLKPGPYFGNNGGRLSQVVFSDAEDARGVKSWPGRREEGGLGLTVAGSLASGQGNGAQSEGVGIGHAAGWRKAAEAMGIDWMNRAELTQAIPPAYTEFIGKQLISFVISDR